MRSNIKNKIKIKKMPSLGGDLFHRVLKYSFWKLILIYIVFFSAFNFVFATFFFAIQNKEQSGSFYQSIISLFIFSIEIFTKANFEGLGIDHPVGYLIFAFEVMIGLLGFGIIAGIVFVRLSKPLSKFQFSDKVVINNEYGKRALVLRVMNSRFNIVSDFQIKLYLQYNEELSSGKILRTISELNVKQACWPLFRFPISIVHYLDKNSLISDDNILELSSKNAQLLVTVKGVDSTYNQEIFSFKNYKIEQIFLDQDFVDIYDDLDDDIKQIDIDKFDLIEPVPIV